MLRLLAVVGMLLLAPGTLAAQPPTRDEALAALRKAVAFHREQVARHGGYVWASSGDLTLREGEAKVGPDSIWVQPPGTPTVGEACLDAWRATGEKAFLDAARDAGEALLRGQLESGGWNYRIEFASPARDKFYYRLDADGKPRNIELPRGARERPAGWTTWSRERISGNQSTLDDDTTQAATRFLIRLDAALEQRDERVHEAARYALRSLLLTQYPNGGWSANYDRFPVQPPSEDDYPIVRAGYPEAWPKTWPKDFTGCYVTNDGLYPDMIDTLLLAYDTYDDNAYRQAALRAGDFLLLAQMPEPQPAWAQQYDAQMHPVWSRAFEPPAVTGGESQGIMEALMHLASRTGEKKYLEPIPRAIAYLRKSQLPDGRLARFYELKTNRPIYFTRNREGKHELTYSAENLATGYGYIVNSRLDALERRYKELASAPLKPRRDERRSPRVTDALAADARRAIDALDERGAWVEKAALRAHKVTPESGVIRSETFVRNVRLLSRYLEATAPRRSQP